MPSQSWPHLLLLHALIALGPTMHRISHLDVPIIVGFQRTGPDKFLARRLTPPLPNIYIPVFGETTQQPDDDHLLPRTLIRLPLAGYRA